MKQLTLIALSLYLLSCGSVKKSIHETNSSYDSTNKVSSTIVSTHTKDSIGTAKSQTNLIKSSDSGYKKTTVIKEYYSDEFDLDGVGPDSVKAVPYISDSPVSQSDYFVFKSTDSVYAVKPRKSKYAGQLLYVETVITEEGKIVKQEDVNNVTEQTIIKSENDFSQESKSEEIKLVKEQSETDKDVTKQRIINLSAVILLFGGLIFIAFRVYISKL